MYVNTLVLFRKTKILQFYLPNYTAVLFNNPFRENTISNFFQTPKQIILTPTNLQEQKESYRWVYVLIYSQTLHLFEKTNMPLLSDENTFGKKRL